MVQSSQKSSPQHFLHILIIIIAVIIGYHQVSFMEHTMKWDTLDQFFPVKYFFSECLSEGIIPFWNPYINLGYPFNADPQSGFYYPLTWLFALTSGYNVYVMNVEFILHVCIAGLGMYQLLRGLKIQPAVALIFTIIFQFSGMFVSNATHLTWVISIAWMPFVIHHYLKMVEDYDWKHALKFGFFLFLCLTGGYPIFTVILNYLLVIFFLHHLVGLLRKKEWPSIKKLIGYNVLGFLTFLLLSSGYIFSFVQASEHIARGQALTAEVANSISFTPKAFLSLLYPFTLTADKAFFETNATMTNLYMGLITLPLLLTFFFTVRNYRMSIFFLFGSVCLLAALGSYLPVRSWLYHLLPLMDMFRHAAIFRTFTIICFIIIAAYAFNQLLKTRHPISLFKGGLLLLAIIIILTTIAAVIKNGGLTFPNDFRIKSLVDFHEKYGIAHHIALQGLIQSLVLVSMIAVFHNWGVNVTSRLKWLTVIVVLEMAAAVQLNSASTIVSREKPRVLQAKIDQFPSGFPVPGNKNISTITSIGDGSLNPIWYNTSIFKKQIAKDGFNNFYLTSYENLILSEEKSNAFKHPFLFAEDSIEMKIMQFGPGKLIAEVQTDSRTTLSMIQNDYPGWQVLIDGKLTAHFKKHFTFISVDLPAGNHQVEFVFHPKGKFWVTWFPLISFFVVLIVITFANFFPANIFTTRSLSD